MGAGETLRPKDEAERGHRAQWLLRVTGLGEPGLVLLVDMAGMLQVSGK